MIDFAHDLLRLYLDIVHDGGVLAWVALGIVVLFVLVAGATLGLLSHHAFTSRRRRLLARRMDIAGTLLAPTLTDPSAFVRAVARCRRRVGDRATAALLREFRARLRGPESILMSKHLESLGEVGRLGRLAGARRMWLRRVAARGLGECGGPQAVRHLRLLLQDQHPDVRRAARGGLLASGEQAGIRAAIASYLKDREVLQGSRAAFHGRLARVAPEELRGLLERGRLEGGERKLALEALGEVRDEHSAPLAEKWLDSDLPELRASAVRVVGKLEHAAQRPRVIEALRDEAWFVRAAAARALETLGEDGPTDAALGRALGDREWWVRANAARALTRRGGPGLDQLLAAVESADRFARDAALAALAVSGRIPEVAGRLSALSAAHPDDATLSALERRSQEASHA